jgi:diaminohydroxyphosphoribosylaminopyrimidine deaminase/5-amino-6-(5-phosphoribosylamino)uracil reductase
MFSEFDRLAMTRALALAERGLETTHPNPRVGCVLAKGERIIAEGWHERAGEAHAEVAALRAAKEPVAGATAYVTLEPCSHYGRTPPCVNALIEARIARVVFAVQDPNPSVSGQGADALLRAGMAVEAGLMEAEATELNIGFMKRMKHGLPWVRVKLAMSLDGRTALANGASQWITGEHARNDVQRWRARCSAVMTGVGTMLADDPQLNVRTVGFKGRQPLRVVLDSWLRSPPGAKMFVGLGAAGAPSGADRGETTVAARATAGAPAAVGVAASGGDVLIFAAAGGGVPTANPAPSVVPMGAAGLADSADLAEDMAALVNAFETSPAAVAVRSADVAGPSSASPPDDATWAGAALSGAVPVDPGQPKAPAVAAGAPLSAPGLPDGTARNPSGQGVSTLSGAAAVPKGTPAPSATVAPFLGASATSVAHPAPIAAASGAAPVAEASGAPVGSKPTLSATLNGSPASGAPSDPGAAAAPQSSPAALQARRAALAARGVRIEEVPAEDGLLDLFAVLQKLAQLDVNEVLVEAGPTLAGQLLATFFVDELLLYIAPKLLGPQGRPLVNLPELQSLQDAWGFALFDAKRFGDDLRLRLRPK